MLFIYYPLILISILGYGFFTSKKLINLKNLNIGHQGIIGIFFLLLFSYITTQFLPHNKLFNILTLSIGIFFFIFFLKEFNLTKKNVIILTFLSFLMIIFILVGKNHDDFHYYHFPYIINITQYPHPIGLGNLNHGFSTHSSIFLLSSLFYLPGVDYNLFHLAPVYILIFSNFILLKLIFNQEIQKKYIFVLFLSLSSLVFINIFFYRLGEHGTDRPAMILIILLFVNLIFFINKKTEKIDDNFLKLFIIIFTVIISMKAFYMIYSLLFFPLIFYVYKKTKSVNSFFNLNLLFCFALFSLVILTNFFNTGCLLFPEKITCFFDFSWSMNSENVEYLRLHFENWAKAGAGAGYENLNKSTYISNFNWLGNWIDKYFFNKVSDLIFSLFFVATIFLFFFKRSKSDENIQRSFKFLYFTIFFIFLVWFLIHPALRYGGYHLFFLLIFIPLSLFLEKFSKNIYNLDKKIFLLILIIALVFVGRNVNRLIKEYKIYSYNPFINTSFSLDKSSFGNQERFKNIIINSELCDSGSNECDKKKEYSAKEIYKNRYIIYSKK